MHYYSHDRVVGVVASCKATFIVLLLARRINRICCTIASYFLRYWVPAENENNQDEADDDEVKFFSNSGYLR